MTEYQKIIQYLDTYFTWSNNEYVHKTGISVFIDCLEPYIIESNKNESGNFTTLLGLKRYFNKYKRKYYSI
ncbi:hypothetical protein UFOVP584_2 [uncultured Caudovirales phage]|uniref:Uncharacterized protein n=1 Tax=uncultured Caudovirales phage TaxID=2100421 RepID=A0A6J5LQD9_9CAUD|nr:hypothetical protein UFOVP304_37 [uncultured Caudovirales phage]CAB4151158.1 hypothetical protein UFOVP584_2 [uncultured Caudovirales phage]